MLITPEEKYYISDYQRLPSGDLKTNVVLNRPDEIALDDVKKKELIIGGAMFLFLQNEARVRRPIEALIFYLQKEEDRWAIRSADAKGADLSKSFPQKSTFISDYGSLPTLEEGLEVLSTSMQAIMPDKDSVTALAPGEGRSITVHRDLYCAIQAFEAAGISLPFALDLSEPIAAPTPV